MTIADDGGEWVRWAVGLALAGLTTAFGFQQRQISGLTKVIDEKFDKTAKLTQEGYNALGRKIDEVCSAIDAHTLDDERTFAKRAEMEKLSDKIDDLRDMIGEIRGGQDRNFGAVLNALDRIKQRNATKDSEP